MKITDLKLNNIGLKLLLFFIFFCPIFYDPYKVITETPIRLNQEQFFQLGTVILFAVIFLENIYLSAFLLWSIALYAYYDFPIISGPLVINIFFGCLLYQVAYKLINRDNIRTVFKVILGLGILNIIWMTFQALNIEFIFGRDGQFVTDLVGLMGLKCFLGMFLAICVPIACYFSWRWSILLFIPIYFSESSVAVVGAIAGFLFTVWYRSKKAFYSFLAIFIVAGSLYVAQDTKAGMFTNRFEVWKLSIHDALMNPIIGRGVNSFGSFGELKPFMYFSNWKSDVRRIPIKSFEVQKETGKFPPMPGFLENYDANHPERSHLNPWSHPHNEYISLLYEFGLIGIIIFLLFARNIFINFEPTDSMIAIMGVFIVFLITSTGQFPLHVARLGIFAPIFLAAYYKIKEEYKGDINGTLS